MNSKTAIIIGGGLGGLFTGAILSKEGIRATVLEKNATIGGGLQTFKRFGEIFDTGMHIIGGMQEGGNIYKICRYLGISDKTNIRNVDDNCTSKLYFSEDKTCYALAKGREPFVNSLARYFPGERKNIQKYVEAIYRLTEEVDLFHLRPAGSNLFSHSEEFTMAANDFIAKYVNDPKLRSIMAYMNPLYGGRGNQTPAYVHAIINVLYIDGTSRFVGGSHLFANTLADVIRSNGGQVHTNEFVRHIDVKNRIVNYISTAKGTYTADYYISAIHPCSMLKLLDAGALPKSYRMRLETIPNSYSAFSLYIKMKENRFQYMNYSEYFLGKYSEIWNFGDTDKPWPSGFMMMTPPEQNQGKYSRKVLVTAPMPFDCVRQWENTMTGHRGDEYEKWKRQCADKLLSMIEEIHPGFRKGIEAVNTSSPLTIRDFYNVKEGALSGYSKDCRNMALSQLPVATKIRNLLLTGQNNNLHGFCGVPLTAIMTCEAILGTNYIINKINKC